MTALESLHKCTGRWNGATRLQDPCNHILDDSSSTLEIAPILGGRFLRIDYDWAYHGKAQQGFFLLGYEAAEKAVTAHWIDTWHMGDKVMACRGTVEDGGSISVRGSYAAPPGPDWGWRILLVPGDQKLRMVMYNITPDGQEELAVEAEYSHARQKPDSPSDRASPEPSFAG